MPDIRSDRAITLKLADYEWLPLDPTNPTGPQMAVLWGDPMSGPYGALLRVPAGSTRRCTAIRTTNAWS